MDDLITKCLQGAFDEYFPNGKPDTIPNEQERDLRQTVNTWFQKNRVDTSKHHFVRNRLSEFLEMLGYQHECVQEGKMVGYKYFGPKYGYVLHQ